MQPTRSQLISSFAGKTPEQIVDHAFANGWVRVGEPWSKGREIATSLFNVDGDRYIFINHHEGHRIFNMELYHDAKYLENSLIETVAYAIDAALAEQKPGNAGELSRAFRVKILNIKPDRRHAYTQSQDNYETGYKQGHYDAMSDVDQAINTSMSNVSLPAPDLAALKGRLFEALAKGHGTDVRSYRIRFQGGAGIIDRVFAAFAEAAPLPRASEVKGMTVEEIRRSVLNIVGVRATTEESRDGMIRDIDALFAGRSIADPLNTLLRLGYDVRMMRHPSGKGYVAQTIKFAEGDQEHYGLTTEAALSAACDAVKGAT